MNNKRKAPTMAEKLASALLELQRLRGDPIDRDDAKAMSAEQICSLFQFDHDAGYACHGAGNHPTGLTPLFIAEHRAKTAKIDAPTIAKVRRLRATQAEFKRRMLAKGGWGEDAAPLADFVRKSRKIPSRPFPKEQRPLRSRSSFKKKTAHGN